MFCNLLVHFLCTINNTYEGLTVGNVMFTVDTLKSVLLTHFPRVLLLIFACLAIFHHIKKHYTQCLRLLYFAYCSVFSTAIRGYRQISLCVIHDVVSIY